MNKKERFVMNLKWASPAKALDELLKKLQEHENVHFREAGPDRDDYDEFLVNFSLKIPSLLYHRVSVEDGEPSWGVFERLVEECTGVYPRYADHEDHDELYVEFAAPAMYKIEWDGIVGWVESLEELLKVADMEGEIEDYVTNKLLEMKK